MTPLWNNSRRSAILWQVAAFAVVGAVSLLLAVVSATNLRQRGIASGFSFLGRTSGFEIGGSLLAYSSRSSYLRALEVGAVNTLGVSLAGILVASCLGLVLGFARLSGIWVVAAASRAYVEIARNTPLLVQLLFWYALSQTLPLARAAAEFGPGLRLCSRGLFLPGLVWRAGSLAVDRPVFIGFNFQGGLSIPIEFAVLLTALSTYTAAFISEIVRGGILSVERRQTEAAVALGLSRAATMRLVVMPQALRTVIPPLTTQFQNLAKNSSLAVAIGYPDIMSVSNTTLNQTGQAIEAIALATLVYLAVGLLLSIVMGAWNRAIMTPGAEGR